MPTLCTEQNQNTWRVLYTYINASRQNPPVAGFCFVSIS